MPNRSKIVYAVALGFLLGNNLRLHMRSARIRTHATKMSQFWQEAIDEYEKNERSNLATINYLANLIDKHGIEIDDFDVVALQYYNH